jgi:hypothetical protein
VNLSEPREKFWGLMDEITAAGISLRGIDLNSFDELLRMLLRGETGIYPATVFFPLRRIERILLDENNGSLPSLRTQFEERTGKRFQDWLNGDDCNCQDHGAWQFQLIFLAQRTTTNTSLGRT